MLRSAPRLRRGALLIRGPHFPMVGPGAAEQRYTLHRVRDTMSSNLQPLLAYRRIGGEFRRRSLEYDAAVAHDVEAA